MSSFKSKEFFEDSKNQVLVAVGIIVLVLAGLLIWWVITPKVELLFSAKSQGELATAAEELRKNNIPFQLGENGSDMLVDKKYLSQSRQLVNNLGLQYDNSVGLELFATSDFGITEFAQKINYKRALEGELTRTISALDEVRYARVHLVIPERKMFDSNKENASASVTLFMRDGYSLSQNRIEGIQSLVANSVPDIQREAVTILDQRGVKISSEKRGGGEIDFSSMLEEKVHIEQYMRDKVDRILSKVFDVEDYSIEVDVQLSSELVKTTEKRLLPLDSGKGAMTINKENKKQSDGKDDKTAATIIEQEFEYGSLLQEIQVVPGRVERISIAVFIFEKLNREDEEDLVSLLAAATGGAQKDGANISIYSKERPALLTQPETIERLTDTEGRYLNNTYFYVGIAVWSIFLVFIIVLLARRNRLSSKDRHMLVEKIKQWDEKNKHG